MAINAALAKKSSAKRKVKKPMSKGAAIGVCVLVFVFILGGIVAALLTNLGGVGEKFLALMPQYKIMVAGIDKQKSDLEAAQAQAQADAEKNANVTKANEKAAADLKTQQDALTAAQQALNAQKKDSMTAEQRKQAVVDIYGQLDDTRAAQMLQSAPTLQDAADILTLLPSDKAAAILGAMNAAKAFAVTKLMQQ